MSWLTSKQTKFTAYASVYTLIVLLALGLVNFLANRYNKSLDLTANKRYSLAEQSEKITRELKVPLTVHYFDRQSSFQNAKDLLDRYANLSTKFSAVYTDPDQDPEVARRYGVQELGSVYVEANGRREQAKAVTEQEITSAMIRALKGGVRRVCAVQGSGEASFDDGGRSGYANFGELLKANNYQIDTVRILEKAEIPASCTLVLIGGPKFDYVPQAIEALKVWVEGGGRLAVFLDPSLQIGTRQVADNQPLLDLLATWGVKVRRDLIFDASLFGPAVPIVQQYGGHVIVREMRRQPTVFSLTRSLELTPNDKAKPEALLNTSANAFATSNMVTPEPRFDSAKDKKGPFVIGAAVQLESQGGKNRGQMVVVGSSEWAGNGYIRTAANQDLAMNIVNWLSSDEDLISIRPREQDNRPLSLTRGGVMTLIVTALGIIPGIALATGIGVWWKRR